ncbi:MAG: 8-amino-7-oxononanoate synthase [Pseudomonadales bacterium]
MSFDDLQRELDSRRDKALYREREILQSAQQPHIKSASGEYLSFCSNDYLGLANHPRIVESFKNAADVFGVGSGASHMVTGHSYHHQALEEELAEFTGRDRALLYTSGYAANTGVIDALLKRGDAVFQDKLNHASLLDGGLLSGAKFQRYLHCDMESLALKLECSEARRKLVVSDSVFSMDGNVADIEGLVAQANTHEAWLMLDDAHGIGVLGETGGGVAEHYGLDQQRLPVLVGTLGKAFGTSGAFVAGSEALIETLIQFSRSYIYTTAMAPAVAAATRTSLKLVQSETWRREHLKELSAMFACGCRELGLTVLPSQSAIQPIMIGSESRALAASEALAKNGIMVKAIRTPTVSTGKARLRVTLSAAHTKEQVQCLLNALAQIQQEINLDYIP